MSVGKNALIIKGQYSGRACKVAYVYWKSPDDAYCQMEENEDYVKWLFVVPHFDHCGSPKAIELPATSIKILE